MLLAQRGTPVEFVHSVGYASARSRRSDLWCRLLGDDGQPVAGVVVNVDTSRKLPWIRLARIAQATRALECLDAATLTRLVEAIGREIPNLARLSVQAYDATGEGLDRQSRLARSAGAIDESAPRGYERTLVTSLVGSEEALHLSLSSSARRNVRQVEKAGFALRDVGDEAFVPRLRNLHAMSHARTGGMAGDNDFYAFIAAAREDPCRSILLGIFHPERAGPNALIGFAHGVIAPNAAIYSVAGTDRTADIGRFPLSYGLLWEVMRWARSTGVSWFDFGGATPIEDASHPLAGISAFKRKFAGEDRLVAKDFVFMTSGVQNGLLEGSGRVLRTLRRTS